MWKENDTLVNGDSKVKILGVVGQVVFMSTHNQFDVASNSNFTKKELEGKGWKLEAKEWMPQGSEKYYFVDTDGSISWDTWETGLCDIYRQIVGNLFRTEEDAEAYKQRLIEAHRKGII